MHSIAITGLNSQSRDFISEALIFFLEHTQVLLDRTYHVFEIIFIWWVRHSIFIKQLRKFYFCHIQRCFKFLLILFKYLGYRLDFSIRVCSKTQKKACTLVRVVEID